MSESMFLSDAELVEFTGYRQAAKQAAHLRAQRVPFHTNRAGRPRVARASVEGRKVSPAAAQSSKPTWSPLLGTNDNTGF